MVICAQFGGFEPDNFMTGLSCVETVRKMSNETFFRPWLSERHKMHSLCRSVQSLSHRWARRDYVFLVVERQRGCCNITGVIYRLTGMSSYLGRHESWHDDR